MLNNDDLQQMTESLGRATGFTPKEMEEVKDVFRYFDKDGNKYLDKEECRCLMKHQTGSHVEQTAFKQIFDKMDSNLDGWISFPEYLSHLSARKRKLPPNYELQEVFDSFDRNADGRLNMDDFRNALLYMGEEAGRADLKSIFVSNDEDKDGLISKYEFQDIIHDKFAR